MNITQFCTTGFVLFTVFYGFAFVTGLGMDQLLHGLVLLVTRFI